jgi:DNA-binding transcriptional LysR family regulator
MLDKPWLERVGKSWRLTPEGERVFPAVKDIVDRYQVLVGGLVTVQPQVHFACGRQIAGELAHEALRIFRRKHPDAVLRISTLRGAARIEGVASGALHLATVSHDEAQIREIAHRELEIEPLLSSPWVAICAADSPWGSAFRRLPRQKTPLKGIVGFPLILPEPDAGLRAALELALKRRGVYEQALRNVVLEIGGWESIVAHARSGVGVGVAVGRAVPESARLLVNVLDSKDCPPVVTRLICRRRPDSKGLDLPPDAQAWREALFEAAAKLSGSAAKHAE